MSQPRCELDSTIRVRRSWFHCLKRMKKPRESFVGNTSKPRSFVSIIAICEKPSTPSSRHCADSLQVIHKQAATECAYAQCAWMPAPRSQRPIQPKENDMYALGWH